MMIAAKMKSNVVKVMLAMQFDGGSIPWEHKTPYEGLSDEQIASMTLEELEQSEHDHMKCNALKVCNKLTCRIDGATVLGGFMKAFT